MGSQELESSLSSSAASTWELQVLRHSRSGAGEVWRDTKGSVSQICPQAGRVGWHFVHSSTDTDQICWILTDWIRRNGTETALLLSRQQKTIWKYRPSWM